MERMHINTASKKLISQINREYQEHLSYITELQSLLEKEENLLRLCLLRKKQILFKSGQKTLH